MSRIPSLGPRGEGWVAIQGVLMVAIVLGGREAVGAQLEPGLAAALTLAGWVAIGAAALLVGWGSVVLGAAGSFTAVPHPTESGRLVDSGPYRWVRHPLYLGLVLGGVGIAAVGRSTASLVLSLALLVVLDVKRRREEAWLLDRYPAYRAYMARTKALLPHLY